MLKDQQQQQQQEEEEEEENELLSSFVHNLSRDPVTLEAVSVSLGDNDATALVEAVTLAKDVGFSPRKSWIQCCTFREQNKYITTDSRQV